MKTQKNLVAHQASMEPHGSKGETGTIPVAGAGATRLVGMPLAAARLLWLLVVVLSFAFFALGTGAHLSNLKWQFPGRFPADLSRNAAGQVLLSPWRNGPLMQAGVLEGDTLLSVDGAPVAAEPGRSTPDDKLSRPVGTRVTVEVRTRSAPPREYTITVGGETARAIGPLGISGDFVATYSLAAEIAFAFVFVAIGALLFVRRSDDWLALLSSGALVILFVGASSPVFAIYGTQPGLRPLLDAWFAISLVTLTMFFYLFPTGRFIPRWTRVLVVALVTAMLLAIAVPSLYPWRMLPWADFLVIFGCLGTAVLAQEERYRGCRNEVQRQQTKWVVFGGAAAAVGLFVKFSLQVVWQASSNLQLMYYDLLVFPAAQLLQVLLPVSILFAILRYKLFDIDIIINRTLVYGSLSGCVFGVYMLVAVGLGALLQTSNNLLISLLAAALVAILFQPLRERIQRAVNRFMYGERDDPYAAISRLGQRLEAAFQPAAVLPTIVETVAQALKLPYAAISLKQNGKMALAAQFGTARGELLRLPLMHAGDEIGELALAPRAVGEVFTAADRTLLADLARQAGVAAYAVGLNLDLDRSRRRVVEAREEARRRLGSDLHDGTGHRLAALARTLERVSGLLRTEPTQAEAALADAREQARAAIGEVRSLAHALHPPDLELLGLSTALCERAAAFSTQGPDGLKVTVDVPEQLPPLLVASEAAAYYIAQEALTNVTKHAAARHCHVSLRVVSLSNAEHSYGVTSTLSDATMLEVEITDDGRGITASKSGEENERDEVRGGLGMHSMRERAKELGGTLVAESPAGGGTRVRALLPAG